MAKEIIRGVSFVIPDPSNCLFKILKCIDIPRYQQYIVSSQSEVWKSWETGGNFFYKGSYSGRNFTRKTKQEHTIIFLKLQVYQDLQHESEYENISTYEEYLTSNCQMIV